MIGTSHEMLLYLLHDDSAIEQLKLTTTRMNMLRHRLANHSVSEDYIIEALEKLGCRCIRPRVILPCIVQDKNGRMFDEYTFVKMFFTHELADRYHANYRDVMRIAVKNQSMNRPLFKHLLKSRRAWIVLDNMVLDSVWSYEPIELTFDADKVKQIRNMLVSSVPVSENARDILTYRRNYPATWTPDEPSQGE